MIDFVCEAVALPSSTKGHFHLFLRKQLSNGEYRQLMDALLEARVIKRNFHGLYLRNKFTLLLKPGLTKRALAA